MFAAAALSVAGALLAAAVGEDGLSMEACVGQLSLSKAAAGSSRRVSTSRGLCLHPRNHCIFHLYRHRYDLDRDEDRHVLR